MKNYIMSILISLSQLGNVILGGYPDESMSARAWRTSQKRKLPGLLLRPVIDGLFYAITWGRDRQHCRDAYESEKLRRQFPKHYQT